MTTSPSERLRVMAHPLITLENLLRDLERRERCCVEGVNGMAGPRGPKQYRRVVRIGADGIKRVAVLPNCDDGDPLYPPTVRSIFRRLGLDPAHHGY